MMADYFYVKVDRKRLREHLAALTGKRCSAALADAWLREHGFEPVGALWRADNVDLSELLSDEVVAVVPEEGVKGDPEHALDGGSDETSVSMIEELMRPGDVGGGNYFVRPPAPVLGDSERVTLREMEDYDRCVIPRFLVAPHRLVKRRADSIVRRAVRDQTWSNVLKKEAFVHIDDIEGWIIVEPNRLAPFLSNEEFPDARLYTVLPQLREYCWAGGGPLVNSEYSLWRAMILEGVNTFWLSLIALASGGIYPPEMGPSYHQDHVDYARTCIQKLLRWWPHVAARQNRLVGGMWRSRLWPIWGVSPRFYTLLGVPTTGEDLKEMSPGEAAALLANAVR